MTTTTDIRTALKAAGYNARQVSVRADRGSFDVSVRRPGIKTSAITSIVRQFRHVRHDGATGAILRGGNTFVFVELDPRLIDARSEDFTTWLNEMEPGRTCHDVPHADLSHLSVNRREENPHFYFVYGADDDVHHEMNAAEVDHYLKAKLVETGAAV